MGGADHQRQCYVSARLSQIGVEALSRNRGPTIRTTADTHRVGRVAMEAGVPLTELRTADGALEELFLELTADAQRERKAA